MLYVGRQCVFLLLAQLKILILVVEFKVEQVLWTNHDNAMFSLNTLLQHRSSKPSLVLTFRVRSNLLITITAMARLMKVFNNHDWTIIGQSW